MKLPPPVRQWLSRSGILIVVLAVVYLGTRWSGSKLEPAVESRGAVLLGLILVADFGTMVYLVWRGRHRVGQDEE